MAVIHRTTLAPTKLEMLTAWMPTRPWYVGPSRPNLVRSGGFRLDDPQGEVGMELMVVTDTSGDEPTAYFVPLTYRGAALGGAEDAFVGYPTHGVLGRRWVYDGCHDPVLTAQLLALLDGRVEAQAQSVSDTPDPSIEHASEAGPFDSVTASAADGPDGTDLTLTGGAVLHINRVLRPGALSLPEGATGHVSGPWRTPDDEEVRGVFAVLRTA
ncbi:MULTISPECIES: maltokinase N-terminal cap-like domain-containing protein [unclassified Streptomyces]|uniref:maltokinase N-terminal cap-like domain-containing protein n=1 Tax=unclassified Streptomyces TaxID=2593676 RepID=UPI000DAC981E|nr:MULTISPECIES: 1,4-alpha-glucan branching protein [unclassified Streptomyces]PZT75706.1 1,4-alpha-glucan branching protein [Streptomyces sp. AC1-42W]PZT80341.1 1,4-alpha-glucan branching protein [Streptomyces sp. AC1-42T]